MALSVSTKDFIGLFLLHSKYDDVIQLWALVMPEEDAHTVVNQIARTNEAEIKKNKDSNRVSNWSFITAALLQALDHTSSVPTELYSELRLYEIDAFNL